MFRPAKRVEKAHSLDIWSVLWSTNQDRIVTASLDGTAKIWSNDLQLLKTTPQEKVGITSAKLLNSGNTLLTCSQDSIIKFFDVESMNLVSQIDPGVMEAWTIDISSDDKYVCSGSSLGVLYTWSISSQTEVMRINLNSKFILQSKFSSDASKIAAGSIDGNLNIVDVESQKHIINISAHSLPVRSISYSHDDKLVFTASDDRHVNIFDARNGRVVTSFSHAGMALSVDTAPDKRHIAVGTADHKISIWDIGSQQAIQTFESQHTEPVWGVSFRRDGDKGNRFVSVGEDAVLQMYECA